MLFKGTGCTVVSFHPAFTPLSSSGFVGKKMPLKGGFNNYFYLYADPFSLNRTKLSQSDSRSDTNQHKSIIVI